MRTLSKKFTEELAKDVWKRSHCPKCGLRDALCFRVEPDPPANGDKILNADVLGWDASCDPTWHMPGCGWKGVIGDLEVRDD